MVYDEATRRLAGSSGQVTADRVLDLERLGFLLRLFAAAHSRLGGRPSLTAVLAGEHHPVPGLDDVAEWPQVPGGPGRVQRLVQLLLNRARSASGRAARTSSTRSGRSGPVARSATLTARLLARDSDRFAYQCDIAP